MKRLALCVLICLTAVMANAQIYYFIKSGSELKSSTKIFIVYVSGSYCYGTYTNTASKVSAGLNKSSYYWSDELSSKLDKQKKPRTIDYDKSTSSFDVYKQATYSSGAMAYGPYGMQYWDSFAQGPQDGWSYWAISSDGKTMVTWTTPKNSDEVKHKTYYEAIDESSLNIDQYDFLR